MTYKNNKKDSFLLVYHNEEESILECNNSLTFSKDFCSSNIVSNDDENYLLDELKSCIRNNQVLILDEELKKVEKELKDVKSQLKEGQYFEWKYKGKVYKLNAKNKVEEVLNPISDTDIIKGIWEGKEEVRLRIHRNEEGVIQLTAFGFRNNLPIFDNKKANLEEISNHLLLQTNIFFNRAEVKLAFDKVPYTSNAQNNEFLSEDVFADGKKIEIEKNASYLQVFSDGVDITKTLIKTGEVEERVYLDKSEEQATIKAPGIVTGSTEAGLSVITDITAAVVMIYDLAVDEDVRKETYNALVKIKDEIKENPEEFFPILKDVILEAVTGNNTEAWEQTTQEGVDKGKKSHLLSRGAVNTTMSVVVSGKIITELPKTAEKLTGEIRKIKIKKIINSLKRFDVGAEFSKGKKIVEETIHWGKNEIKLTWKRVGNKIDFGDRKDLARILGTTNYIEAHHIIPWNICLKNKIIQKAALDGFHPNMLQNGIGLEKYTKLIGKGMHGNHPAYDNYVKNKLDKFLTKEPMVTPEQANKFLQEELIPDLKEKIIKAKNSGMNLNEYFKVIN